MAQATAKGTLLGIPPPAVLPAGSTVTEDKAATWERAAERIVGGIGTPDGPTPLEVPISSATPRNRDAAEQKPTGVAKPYIPKDVNTPPVVVDAAALKAGESAAQAEQARRSRQRRSANATTIPGNVRIVPRGPGLTPTIERIDANNEFAALRPSRTPLVLGVLLLVGAVAGGAWLMNSTSDSEKAATSVAKPAPAPVAPPAAPAPADSAETKPAAGSAPADSAAPASANPQGDAEAASSAEAQNARRDVAANRGPSQRAPQPAAHKQPAKRPSGSTPAPSPAPAKGKGTIVRETPF